MASTYVEGTLFCVRKKDWFSFFIIYYLYKQMHTHTYIYIYIYNHFTSAQQAKMCIISNNAKLKLWKTKAVIWFNKMCRTKQPSPKYIGIKGALEIKFNILMYIYYMNLLVQIIHNSQITTLVTYVVNFFLLCCRRRKTN
jgi:hypothetical protein